MEIAFLVTVAILAVVLLAILYYLGVFIKVKVEVKRPPFAESTFLYKFHQGPYNNAGKAFEEISKLTNKFHCAGIYFDDPETVASNETCYAVGVLIEKEKSTKDDTEEVTENMRGVGYKSLNIPAVEKAMCSVFPFKPNFLCILVAVAKVYPALREYIKEHEISPHPYLEYYKGDKIFFVAPLEKHEEFYVPEYAIAKKNQQDQAEKSE